MLPEAWMMLELNQKCRKSSASTCFSPSCTWCTSLWPPYHKQLPSQLTA